MTKDEANFQSNSHREGPYHAEFLGLDGQPSQRGGPEWHVLAEFTLCNDPGGETLAQRGAQAVIEAVSVLHLPAVRLEKLKAAVASAALNAVEHRDRLHPELPISLRIYIPEKLDPHAVHKLTSSPRGWGFFFIEKLVESGTGEAHPLVELFLYQEGSL